jgi:hypothetical protein
MNNLRPAARPPRALLDQQIIGIVMCVLLPISYGLLDCIPLPSLLPTGMSPVGRRRRTGGSDRQSEYENMTLLMARAA